MATEPTFEAWCIVELFGHQKMAGLVTEATIGGCAFIRVDVPKEPDGFITRFLGAGAIYAINPVDEAIAREAVKRVGWKPVYSYELPALEDEAGRRGDFIRIDDASDEPY